MDEIAKARITSLLEQAEQEAEQRGYTAGLAAGTEAAKREALYEEPFGGRRHGPAPASAPYDNSPEARLRRHQVQARLRRHQALWDLLDDKTDRIAELEAEVARLQALVPAMMPAGSCVVSGTYEEAQARYDEGRAK